MIQIDGIRRQVYIKVVDPQKAVDIVAQSYGTRGYIPYTGQHSVVRVSMAALGPRRVRVANSPPELPDNVVQLAFARFGDVKCMEEEFWSRQYRYKVSTGIRIISINLKNIPSHLKVEKTRAFVFYDGQPATRYRCHQPGHTYHACPQRRREVNMSATTDKVIWTETAATARSTILKEQPCHILKGKKIDRAGHQSGTCPRSEKDSPTDSGNQHPRLPEPEGHIPAEEGRIQEASDDEEQQRERNDTRDGTDVVGVEDRPELIPMEQLPCTSGTRKLLDGVDISKVLKGRQNEVQGTGVRIVDEPSPPIQDTERIQDQQTPTQSTRKEKKVEVRSSKDRKCCRRGRESARIR